MTFPARDIAELKFQVRGKTVVFCSEDVDDADNDDGFFTARYRTFNLLSVRRKHNVQLIIKSF